MSSSVTPLKAPPEAPVTKARTTWIVTAAVIYIIQLCVWGHRGAFGSRGPNIYWAFHWASDYSHGFIRRGLLGEILRLLHLDNTSYGLITVISALISIALYAAFMSAVLRLAGKLPGLEQTLVAVILGLSPMTAGIIIQTSGDPIQLLMLCFLILFAIVIVPNRGIIISALSFSAFAAVAALTHEASIFFILPALAISALILQKTPSARAAFFGNLVSGIVCTVVIVMTTQKLPDGALPPELPTLHYHGQLSTMPPDTFPKFSQLLAIEDQANFGHGIKGDVGTAIKLAGVLALPFLLICFTTALFYGRDQGTAATRRKVFAAFAIPVLLSVPLYIIGHDWGRFVAYSFMLSLSVLTWWRVEPVIQPPPARQIPIYLGLLVAGFTLVPTPIGFLLTGMMYSRINFVGEFLLLALLVFQTRSYWAWNLSMRDRS